MALWRGDGSGAGGCAAAECDSFNGRIRGRRGGTLPTVFNAANERAVQKFLDREIGYLTITDMIEAAMEHHTVKENPTVEEILAAEQETYDFIESRW